MVVPVTRYAKSGDVHIAYQVFGSGATDLVFVPGFISHIENYWEHPDLARWLLRLGAFARVIMFDKRGTGLSDPVSVVPSLDLRMDDVRAVMDAAGSERAALLGVSEGGSLAALFAATYPQRCLQLVLYGAFARFPNAAEALKRFCSYADQAWGSGLSLSAWAPSRQNDRTLQQWWGRYERLGASPAAAMAVTRMATETDVGDIVSSIRVPTLVIHSKDDTLIPIECGRFLARNIRGARLIELPGQDHLARTDGLSRNFSPARCPSLRAIVSLRQFCSRISLAQLRSPSGWVIDAGAICSVLIIRVCGENSRGTAAARSNRWETDFWPRSTVLRAPFAALARLSRPSARSKFRSVADCILARSRWPEVMWRASQSTWLRASPRFPAQARYWCREP